MKAALNYKYGPPETVQILDVPKPEILNMRDVLVKVHASSVNRTDCGFLRAHPFVTRFFSGLTKPRHPILGCEFAGEVVAVGASVTEFAVGDKVFGFDDVGWGGHAEYKVITADKSIVKIPSTVSYEQAAASGEGAHYALSYVHAMQKVGAKRVLVHGATGAIGSAAVQMLKIVGFYVVATSTTKDFKTVSSLGADAVIDWQKTDFTKLDEMFDAVFDSVSKSTFKACRPLLKPQGIYIATEFGPYGQNPLLALVSPIYKLIGRKRVLFPLPRNNKVLFEYIAGRLADGTFTPVVDRTYRLDDIVEAYKYVETGQKTGNVLIQIAE